MLIDPGRLSGTSLGCVQCANAFILDYELSLQVRHMVDSADELRSVLFEVRREDVSCASCVRVNTVVFCSVECG